MDDKNPHHPEHQEEGPTEPVITLLQRREIQAPIAACLIREYAGVMGLEKALETATAAIQADAAAAGRLMAERFGGSAMKDLVRVVKEIWTQDGALTIRVLEETEHVFRFDVTRCRYAELYGKTGVMDLGFCLSCSRDEPFVKGFNPRVRFSRSGTIMQGSPVCDFRFVLD